MSAVSAAAPPSAAAWRVLHRRARRRHHPRSPGDLFSDLYMLLWLVLVYGGALVAGVRRHLEASAGAGAVPAETSWVLAATLLAVAGLTWRALRALGPMVATPAEQAWAVSTPLDRRAWLLPRFASLVAMGAALGAAIAALGALLASASAAALGWAALTGAATGAAGVSALVAAQAAASRRRGPEPLWPGLAGMLLVAGGAALAVAVVAGRQAGWILPHPIHPPLPSAAGLALVAAAAAGAVAVRSLPGLAVASLNAGAQLASAVLSATVWLDPSLLSGVLEARRWRALGTVRSRRFLAGPFPTAPLHAGPLRVGSAARISVLLQAEGRRQLRRPGALAVWAGLAVAAHAVALLAPSTLGVARILLGYLATGRLMSGLRTLSASPGLQRALGGSTREQRLAHLVLPALGAGLWWAVTAGAATAAAATTAAATAARMPAPAGTLDALLVAGIVSAAYRASTRPPMSYGGAVFETPLGLFPMEMMLQLSRGLDLLGATVVLEILARG